MVFGNEHLGRAVVFLRESQNLKQHELAERLDIKPPTLHQYETGRRGMTENMVKKIAVALGLDEIVLWDTAHKIFRYNYFHTRAKEEGIAVEELIARIEIQPSIEQVMESYDSKTERDRQYTEITFRFLESLGRRGPDGFDLLKVLVKPRDQNETPRKKALRLEKGSQRRES
jgi:transcriptional regulator with XRE-family HTH domain